jgi:hypothetical protein
VHPSFPAWLEGLSVVSIAAGAACAAIIAADETGRRQRMWIMNLVWPLTALFGSALWLAFYWRWGRGMPPRQMGATKPGGPGQDTPMAIAVAKGTSHCGAGCALGDLIAEWLAFGFPAIAVAFGWKSLFGEKTFAVWVLDFLVAFVLGVGFQYFTIKPMRNLSVQDGIWAALKADAASITSWQIGMYGAMAVIQFLWFRPAYGGVAPVDSVVFWFAMQIAMLCGFCTAYPVNWLLVKLGLKEKM